MTIAVETFGLEREGEAARGNVGIEKHMALTKKCGHENLYAMPDEEYMSLPGRSTCPNVRPLEYRRVPWQRLVTPRPFTPHHRMECDLTFHEMDSPCRVGIHWGEEEGWYVQ